MNLAELTSFDALLGLMMQRSMISQKVISRLLSLFASKSTSPTKRKASLIALTMLAKTAPEIIQENVELFRQIGLIESEDLGLAKCVCVAFQQIAVKKSKPGVASVNTSANGKMYERFSKLHPLFENLRDLILDQKEGQDEW